MLNLSRAVVRSFASSSAQRSAAKGEIDKGYFELKKIQEHFQKKDGKPVFLKGSPFDLVLYRVTFGLALVGIAGMAHFFYDITARKK